MRADELLDGIGEVKDEFIQDAKSCEKTRTFNRRKWAGWVAAAAACVAVITGGITILNGQMHNEGTPAQAGGSGHDEGTVFMSYAGPVFPLTFMEKADCVDAVRNVNYDFSTYLEGSENDEELNGNGSSINVKDTYVLTNHSDEDARITAVYPFTGDFQAESWPVVTVNDMDVEWKMNAGAYSGSFTGAGDEISSSLNLENITSWTGYEELLKDGSYFDDAFTGVAELEQPVVVYRLSDLTAGTGEYDAASLCMSFEYDPEKTDIMTWGFNGGGTREDTGEEYRDFFIRDGLRKADENVKYFIAVGEDIHSYNLQGYMNGACNPGEEIADATATVTREETTIGEVLREIAHIKYDGIIGNGFDEDQNRYINEEVSFDMYYEAVAKHFAAYSILGIETKERYDFGMLDEFINETVYHDRVFYLSVDIVIPANESIELSIDQLKEASFDFYCSGSENTDVYGYDMVTSLGSNVNITEQTAAISNYAAIEIVRQNFGFDIANGIDAVTLASEQPHYYLEIRKMKIN